MDNDKNDRNPDEREPDRNAPNDSQNDEWKRPITNQDEQRQTTNAGTADDSGRSASNAEASKNEKESDRQQDERLRPYKNVGDDSEEVDKKTPTME